MDQVSSIRKARGRVDVTFSDGEAMPVPSPLFALKPLHTGDCVERDEYIKWLRENEYPHALTLAVRYLTGCDRSRMETCVRLTECGYASDTAQRAADYLIQRGLMNDARLAGLYAESRGTRFGRLRIAQELKRKGIDGETVENAVASIDENKQVDRAARLAAQYAARKNSGEPRTLNQRIVGMLMRRGFTYSQSRQAANNAVPSLGDVSAEDEGSS